MIVGDGICLYRLKNISTQHIYLNIQLMVFYYIVYNVCNYLLTVLKELRSKTLYHWINIVSRKKKNILKKKSKSIRSEKTYDKRVQYVQLYIFLNYTFIDKNI